MANSILSNGLLGMGGFSPQMPGGSLLGEFYDPQAARNYQIKQMLLGMGMGLMSEKGIGRGAELALAMGTRAGEDYRQSAFDAYRLQAADDERQYRRERDAADDKRLATQDAWANTFNQMKLDEYQQQQDQQAQADQAFQNLRTMPRTDVPVQNFGMADQLWQMGQKDAALGMVMPQSSQNPMVVGENSSIYDPTTRTWTQNPNASVAPNWKEVVLEDGVYWIDENNPQNRQKIGERPNRNEGEGREFTQEGRLRTEYIKEAKPFTDLRINYQKILASAQDNTGASDIAMVYSFMKMLDPTSVVREGEFATAENAGGVPTQIMTMYNRALTGERLAPEIRQQFLQQAGRQFEQQNRTYQGIRQQYQTLAQQYGVDPERVAPDLSFGVSVLPQSPQPTPSPGNIPQEAIQELLTDPSPQAIREFDEAFGPGAAASVLGRR